MDTRNRLAPSRDSGFTLIEVCFALLIFGAMATVFATVFPVVLKSSTGTGRYSQASSLGLHKLDQIRAAGYAQAQTPASLVQQGVADSGTAQGNSVPFTVDFTAVDHLASGGGFLPSGSRGSISVVDYNSINSSVPTGNVLSVTATILWTGGGSTDGQYSVSTLIAKVEH